MRTPSQSSSSSLFIQLFVYLVAGLRCDRLAAALAAVAEPILAALRKVRDDVELAKQAVLEARARCNAADRDLDQAVNLFEANLLVSVGRNRKTLRYRKLFPAGLMAVTRVRTEDELAMVRALEEAMRTEMADSPLATEHLPRIAAAREETERRFAEWQAAKVALAAARGAEWRMRGDAREQYRVISGKLIATFPDDPRKADSFFMQPSEARALDDEDDDSEDPSASPAAVPAVPGTDKPTT